MMKNDSKEMLYGDWSIFGFLHLISDVKKANQQRRTELEKDKIEY